MSTDSELIQKRQEVQEEILALKDKIPAARILNALGKAFEQRSLGYWLSNFVLLNLILLSPWAVIGSILKEFEKTIPVVKAGITAIEITILNLGAVLIIWRIFLNDVSNRIVRQISAVDNLSDISRWFKKSWSTKSVLTFALPLCLLWTLLGVGATSSITHRFIGFGFTITTALVGSLVGIEFYGFLLPSSMFTKLKEYQFEINVFSPADSEIGSNISEISTKNLYIEASLVALVTLIATSSFINQQIRTAMALPVLAFGWTVIITNFLLTRSTLGRIINRTKWKTLNRIRDKMNVIEATGDLSDKDTAERLLRLADIHRQVMASHTKMFNLKSVITLFSQLMLPLIGLLLGNLDKVLELLKK